jgi:protein-disulfide isomerase
MAMLVQVAAREAPATPLTWPVRPPSHHTASGRFQNVRQAGQETTVVTSVAIGGSATKGSRSARVAIVEYADFECSYCGAFARETLPRLDAQYVKTGKVLLVFKHRPITSIHPNALRAGTGAECAREQGSFWPMHDLLFSDQSHLSEAALLTRAARLALDIESFRRCLTEHGVRRVNDDAAAATALQITGTPTFLIGTIQSGGTILVRERLEGARSLSAFQPVLDRLLAEAK